MIRMMGWGEPEGDAMTRTLPAFIGLRRSVVAGNWWLSCRACGVREEWHGFWAASYAAHGHADMHADELDDRAESSQLLRLGRQAGLVSQSEDVLLVYASRRDLRRRLRRSAFDLDFEGLQVER